jgi:molybdopterin-binding protein
MIDNTEIIIVSITDIGRYSAANRLPCTVTRVDLNEINAEIYISLSNGETLSSLITRESAKAMKLTKGTNVWILFTSTEPMLGIKINLKLKQFYATTNNLKYSR